MKNLKIYLAELVGTFILVFIGVGAVVVNAATSGAVGIVGIALAFGFSIMASVYIFGRVSGSHINPAVTIAFWALRRIKAIPAAIYIVAQLAGATLASLLLWYVAGARELVAIGVTGLLPEMTLLRGATVEAVLTFFLVMTVLAFLKQDSQRPFIGGMAVGLVVSMDIILGAVFTGASMNPARSFGPALVTMEWAQHSVYWAGPIVGGLVAVITTRFWK